jgi:hypothetical protein
MEKGASFEGNAPVYRRASRPNMSTATQRERA